MPKKKDRFTLRAREEGYQARSAYKLKEINKEFSIIKSGYNVLDLGCSPGGWSQIALEAVGPQGSVMGVDDMPVRIQAKNFEFIHADIFEFYPDRVFDVVISDMAPRTTGQRQLDQERSYQLSLRALAIAKKNLRTGGSFLVKIFQGPNYEAFLLKVKNSFGYSKTVKPKASKSDSKEMYVLGKNKK